MESKSRAHKHFSQLKAIAIKESYIKSICNILMNYSLAIFVVIIYSSLSLFLEIAMKAEGVDV